MEKFFLCRFFSYNKLNVIDQKNINISVFFTEFGHSRVISVSDGFDQFIGEFFAGYIQNFAVFIVFNNIMSDGMHQMCFSKSGTAIDKERVVGISRRFGNCQSCGLSKFVIISDNKSVKNKAFFTFLDVFGAMEA